MLSSLATKVADSIQIGYFGLLQRDDPDSDGYAVGESRDSRDMSINRSTDRP